MLEAHEIRGASRLAGWIGLILIANFAASTRADPITVTTSGEFQAPYGTLELAGTTSSDFSNGILLGSVTLDDQQGFVNDSPFQVQFQFNQGLPPIEVTGVVTMLDYNFDEPVMNSVVSTTATAEQIELYPQMFQDLLQHPDWLHTGSFDNDVDPVMQIRASVHVEDPHEIRPIPEPASLATFLVILGGLGWRSRPHRGPE